MLETTITVLATICAAGVAAMSLYRWQRFSGEKGVIYLCVGILSGFVALLNLTAIPASTSFVQTAALAYVGFAMAIVLPVARAIANLTYDAPERTEHEDATV